MILTDVGVHELRLPGLTRDDAIANANALLAASRNYRGAASAIEIQAVLSWMWETIAEPVLNHLDYTRPIAEGEMRRRIWWMPTGPLTVLPLHAAGQHTDASSRSRAVIDRVVSSYTPTIRALHHARRPSSVSDIYDVNQHLVVAVTDTPNQELRHAKVEANLVAQLLPADTKSLQDGDATLEDVKTRLADAGLVHFACHALTTSDPSQSYLSMHDAPLRVSDLASLRNDEAYLAYLSACTTASEYRLLDEAIHVATAFQLAGYRHVIGTLWPTVDRVARDIAGLTYRGLLQRQQPAHAIHDAILAMRAKHLDVPYLWGAHIHIGP